MIKRNLYTYLSRDNYLRILQRSYFFLYGLGLLKFNHKFAYHYYAKNLIKKGDTVIDIGANLGYYSILFARWVGNKGKVYSVEPVSIYNKIFEERARKYSNITLFPYALGSEEKNVELVSVVASGYLRTGLAHVYNAQKDDANTTYGFRVQSQMKIASKLFADIEKIDYIKIDIEGDEFVVLSDMKELIQRHKPIIQVEMNDHRIFYLLNQLGYSAYQLVSGNKLVKTKIDSEKVYDGDFLFFPEQYKK
jgi:FkbM family methyltransferase